MRSFLSFVLCLALPLSVSAAWIKSIEEYTGTNQIAPYAISGDGKTLAGVVVTAEARKGVIVSEGQIIDIGDLPGGRVASTPRALSHDGSIVVGNGEGGAGLMEAIVYQNGVLESIGDLPGSDYYSEAMDVSADGSVIVGKGVSERGLEPFVYSNNMMTGLGYLGVESQLGRGGAIANAVSADGSTIVGGSSRPGSSRWGEAFVYRDGQMQGLGTISGDGSNAYYSSTAKDVSGDGARIVGISTDFLGMQHAFLYENGEMNYLSDVSGVLGSRAEVISDDGKTVIGTFGTGSGSIAVIWLDNGTGKFKAWLLKDYLTLIGMQIEKFGWSELVELVDMSADGKRIIGIGLRGDDYEYFVLDLTVEKPKKKKRLCKRWGYCEGGGRNKY